MCHNFLFNVAKVVSLILSLYVNPLFNLSFYFSIVSQNKPSSPYFFFPFPPFYPPILSLFWFYVVPLILPPDPPSFLIIFYPIILSPQFLLCILSIFYVLILSNFLLFCFTPSLPPYFTSLYFPFSHGQFYRIAVVNRSRELLLLFLLGPLEDITGAQGI